MTMAELKQVLSEYPDDMKVKVNIGHEFRKLNDVSCDADMNINITYVWSVGKEKK